jgi:methionyl-tRNA formyltransferase
LRLGFAGTPEFAVPALDALVGSRHSVVAAFTQPDRPAGRGQIVRLSAVKKRALELNIAVHQPRSFKTPDAEAVLRELALDALVVVAYGLILPVAVLELPVLGCFNIHASLLPRWRGAAPIQRALLAGDEVTGITIMRMEAGLDTGPMLATRELAIASGDTGGTLHDRLARLGGELVVETLDAVAAGRIEAVPQPSLGITYAEKINKSEAAINWHDDVQRIQLRVRAFNPWPVAETTLNGLQLRVWDAAAVPTSARSASASLPGDVIAVSPEGIDVACGRGALRIQRLQLAGRKPLAAAEFIKSQHLLGARFGNP